MTRTETALSPLIRNAEATLVEHVVEGVQVPVIIPDLDPTLPPAERCWTTCLESAVVGFVMDEWRAKRRPTGLAAVLGNAAAGVLSCGPWQRAVQVGSLPFSTTLRSEEDERAMWRLLPELREEMPERPFAIRHVLPDEVPAEWRAETVLLPARVVYLQDFTDGQAPPSKDYRRDLKRLNVSGLVHLTDPDFDNGRVNEVIGLYRQLYRDRYTIRHPDYTPGMIELARQRGWLSLGGLADPANGRLLGFFGIHAGGRVMTTPILGHDTTLPQKAALYRQLSAMATEHAMRERMWENASSGAGDFKRRRNFKPVLEYLLVLPPLAGRRRFSDRAILKACGKMTKRVTMEDFIAAGG
ncbi:hypothetical protein [Luteolibacter sp. LG18]|uniref:hypothetical protein n=1 Tax=Luteolibacter sp. LG18 TaxID=2819286 RepID=UPI002B292610|nr:hypothetical protein llg_12110 [Luteolibacter sp. LG18]